MIVDDERSGSDYLKSLIHQHCPRLQLVGMAVNTPEAIALYEAHQPRVVFLDINLPGGSGFQLLPHINQQTTDVVFTTAYDEFAAKAFRVAATDYLLKPIDPDELKSAVARVEETPQGNWQARFDMLEAALHNPKQPNTIMLRSTTGFRVAEVNRIVRCQSEGNYTKLFFDDDSTYLASKNLKEFEAMLKPFRFFRIHQSHLVNLAHVKAYHKGRIREVELSNGTMVDLARSKRARFLDLFG